MIRPLSFILVCLAFIGVGVASSAPLYRPGQEYRSISSTTYQVSIQKNGRVDVNLLSGPDAPVVANVYPMVWFEGEEAPEPMDIDARFSGNQPVSDRLGEGQGIIFRKGNCEWGIRTYTSQPFLAFQAVYVNDTSKPVKVKMIMPVTTDEKTGGVTLGEGTQSAIVSTRRLGLPWDSHGPRLVRGGNAKSWWDLAALNATNGRNLIAGALTHDRAVTYLELGRPTAAAPDKKVWSDARNIGARFQRFQIASVFDPPVEVAPGDRLLSETVYVAVTEPDAVTGLERYGQAVAVVQRAGAKPGPAPNGVVLSEAVEDEPALLFEADALAERYAPLGLNHLVWGQAWPVLGGVDVSSGDDFTALAKLVQAIHGKNIRVALPLRVVSVDAASPIAQAHPDWIAPLTPNGQKRMGESRRVLDISVPGVEDHVRSSLAQAVSTWNLDAVAPVADLQAIWCVDRFHDPAMTRVEAIRRVLALVREAVGPDRAVCADLAMPLIGTFADGLMLPEPNGRLTDTWYEHPALWRSAGSPIPVEQFSAGVNAALSEVVLRALTGGPVQFEGVASHLPRSVLKPLRRILPALDRTAKPVDFFDRESPAIWAVGSRRDETRIAAVFNTDGESKALCHIDFASLGLHSDVYYAVYNLWEDTYYGSAQQSVDVEVEPQGHALFLLTPQSNEPMVLANGTHIFQSEAASTNTTWKADTKTLSGNLTADEPGEYAVQILAPEGMMPTAAKAAGIDVLFNNKDRITTITIITSQAGDIPWELTF